MRALESVATAFDAACRDVGVAYAFVGGVAVMAWGQPRATSDVDALVVLPPERIPALAAQLRARGFSVDERDLADALREGGHASVFDEASSFHVDLAFARLPEEREEIGRAVDLSLSDGRIRVVGPEETIAFKLRFGSEQDVKDARSILVRQAGRLDEFYLSSLAERMSVQDALDALRKELEGEG